MKKKASSVSAICVLAAGSPQICTAASTATSTPTPTRSDVVAAGDRITLKGDAPIFRINPDPQNPDSKPINACAPDGSQLEVTSAPATETKTESTPAGAQSADQQASGANRQTPGTTQATTADTQTTTTTSGSEAKVVTTAKAAGDQTTPSTTQATPADTQKPLTTTTTSGSETKVVTTAKAAGDKTTTTIRTVATATFLSVGPAAFQFGRTATCANPSYGRTKDDNSKTLPGYVTVQKGLTYEFTPSDLDKIRTLRYGWTYGALVVPNKVIISSRTFISSSSVLPYIGYQGWVPGQSTAVVFAAGVGTAPASAQTSNAGASGNSTQATFSVATGVVFTFGGVFKAGILLGVDTVGENSGYKYQGKPWFGLSLGAGTQ